MRIEQRIVWRFILILLFPPVWGCGTVAGTRLEWIQFRIAELRNEARTDNGGDVRHAASQVGHAASHVGSTTHARPATVGGRADVAAGTRRTRDGFRGASLQRPGPLPGFLDTLKRDVRAMPAELWTDIQAVYASPRNLAILGLGYGGSLALQSGGVDDTIEDSLADESIFSDDANVTFSVLGNPGVHLGLAGLWYLIGQQTENEKTYQVGKTLFSALIINGLSTTAGKYASWDRAPNGEPFTFPSAHASSTFTLASVLHRAYGPWVGIPLYGLGVVVAVERLDDDEHYLSDVLMGSVMGLVIGHTVAGKRDLELYGGRIIPYADPITGSVGLAWHKRF